MRLVNHAKQLLNALRLIRKDLYNNNNLPEIGIVINVAGCKVKLQSMKLM